MKFLKMLFLVLLIGFFSCSKDEDKVPTCEECNFDCLEGTETNITTSDCFDNSECSFKVFANSKVDIEEFDGKGTGDKNFFQLLVSSQGDEFIIDDEFTDILVFELDSEQDSFSAGKEDFDAMNAHYRFICFCTETEFKKISDGCIQGVKDENGVWFIQGRVEIEYESGPRTERFDVELEEG